MFINAFISNVVFYTYDSGSSLPNMVRWRDEGFANEVQVHKVYCLIYIAQDLIDHKGLLKHTLGGETGYFIATHF